jgi:hypothetical protein
MPPIGIGRTSATSGASAFAKGAVSIPLRARFLPRDKDCELGRWGRHLQPHRGHRLCTAVGTREHNKTGKVLERMQKIETVRAGGNRLLSIGANIARLCGATGAGVIAERPRRPSRGAAGPPPAVRFDVRSENGANLAALPDFLIFPSPPASCNQTSRTDRRHRNEFTLWATGPVDVAPSGCFICLPVFEPPLVFNQPVE